MVLYWPVIIEKDADGYFAHCPQLQGCYTQGDTYAETIANIRDAIQLHIEDRLASGEPLPQVERSSDWASGWRGRVAVTKSTRTTQGRG